MSNEYENIYIQLSKDSLVNVPIVFANIIEKNHQVLTNPVDINFSKDYITDKFFAKNLNYFVSLDTEVLLTRTFSDLYKQNLFEFLKNRINFLNFSLDPVIAEIKSIISLLDEKSPKAYKSLPKLLEIYNVIDDYTDNDWKIWPNFPKFLTCYYFETIANLNLIHIQKNEDLTIDQKVEGFTNLYEDYLRRWTFLNPKIEWKFADKTIPKKIENLQNLNKYLIKHLDKIMSIQEQYNLFSSFFKSVLQNNPIKFDLKMISFVLFYSISNHLFQNFNKSLIIQRLINISKNPLVYFNTNKIKFQTPTIEPQKENNIKLTFVGLFLSLAHLKYFHQFLSNSNQFLSEIQLFKQKIDSNLLSMNLNTSIFTLILSENGQFLDLIIYKILEFIYNEFKDSSLENLEQKYKLFTTEFNQKNSIEFNRNILQEIFKRLNLKFGYDLNVNKSIQIKDNIYEIDLLTLDKPNKKVSTTELTLYSKAKKMALENLLYVIFETGFSMLFDWMLPEDIIKWFENFAPVYIAGEFAPIILKGDLKKINWVNYLTSGLQLYFFSDLQTTTLTKSVKNLYKYRVIYDTIYYYNSETPYHKNTIITLFEWLVPFFGTIFTSIFGNFETIEEIVSTAIGWIKSGIKNLWDYLYWFFDKICSVVSISFLQLKKPYILIPVLLIISQMFSIPYMSNWPKIFGFEEISFLKNIGDSVKEVFYYLYQSMQAFKPLADKKIYVDEQINFLSTEINTIKDNIIDLEQKINETSDLDSLKSFKSEVDTLFVYKEKLTNRLFSLSKFIQSYF